jgi:hypothetical protein
MPRKTSIFTCALSLLLIYSASLNGAECQQVKKKPIETSIDPTETQTFENRKPRIIRFVKNEKKRIYCSIYYINHQMINPKCQKI